MKHLPYQIYENPVLVKAVYAILKHVVVYQL